jgi:hypothetical protein
MYIPFAVYGADPVETKTARTIDVSLRIDPQIYPVKNGEPPKLDPVLNRANLIAIKQFILKQEHKETYCNMYNNNPFFAVKNYRFYLNPDPGPNGHPQFNVNCDPQKTDFHTLVIRNMDWGPDQYRHIQFKKEVPWIDITVSWPNNELNVGKIRNRAEEAVNVILEEMKRLETSPRETAPHKEK